MTAPHPAPGPGRSPRIAVLALPALAAALLLPACGGGGGGSDARLRVERITHGFNSPPLSPHQIYRFDPQTGQPNRNVVLEIRSMRDIEDNLRPTNGILGPGSWLLDAADRPVLPNGARGNHFLLIEFSVDVDLDSIFDPTPAGQNNSGLLGTITIARIDTATGAVTPITGRGFVNGITPDGQGGYATWIEERGGQLIDVSPNGEGRGFPGVGSPFNGSPKLVRPDTFIFVPDVDGDLATFESFPRNAQIRIEVSNGVRSSRGRQLEDEVVTAGSVGRDVYTPEAIVFLPANGEANVDPTDVLEIEFSEPIQPLTLGQLPGPIPPGLSPAVTIQFGPPNQRVDVPFTARPISPYNLTRFVLDPVFDFPGRDPFLGSNPSFNEVTVAVMPGVIADLVEDDPNTTQNERNFNVRTPTSTFQTGEGPGIVNAPVSPSAIYVGRTTGVSVVDLYGFGQSTGDPTPDDPRTLQIDGVTKFPFNQNIIWGASLFPPISTGQTTLDGGSAGVFTLTKDSSLNDLVVRSPLVGSVDDIHIGQPLDKLFNNSDLECLALGGNPCARTGALHLLGATPIDGNAIQIAPHPNPPKIRFPPICVSPFIQVEEPTSAVQPNNAFDLMGAGNAFGRPEIGIPPTGLLVDNDGFFGVTDLLVSLGNPAACAPYAIRQQIGHFLYVIDRSAASVKVFNSNRMQLIDVISSPDPTDLAISPNLKILAIANFGTNSVTFVDVEPNSPAFHTAVKTVPVGRGPRSVVFMPENEDCLVANFTDNSVTIIRQVDLTVRKTITNQVSRPIDIAVTPRQLALGFNHGIYYAYILNASGAIAVFESGPDGTNGIGYDNVIGLVQDRFAFPTAMQVDPVNLNSAVWVAHGDASGRGMVSNLALTDAPLNQIPLSATGGGFILPPSFRDKRWQVVNTVDVQQLTGNGIPTDIALDNLTNIGGLPGISTLQAGTAPAPHSGKSLYRLVNGVPVAVSAPSYLFVANPSGGVVDVIDVSTSRRLLAIPASGATVVSDYWRQ